MKKFLGLGLIAILLPLFVWTVINITFNIREKASTQDYIPPFPPHEGVSAAPFRILFININNAPHFDAIVDGSINNKFKSITPYKENIDLIAFYKININFDEPIENICSETGIAGSSGYACDSSKIFSKITADYPNFKQNEFIPIALVETTWGGSSGQLVTVGVYPNSDEQTTVINSSNTIIHEVSHQFGLLDYAMGYIKYDGSPNFLWDPQYMNSFYNLDNAGCDKWCSNHKPVSEYNSSCLNITDKQSCITHSRSQPGGSGDYCIDGACCIWSDTPFEYFNSKCAPLMGKEDIGLQCIPQTGCYFGASYSHYSWKPTNENQTVLLSGDGVLDKVSERHIESVFRCCMNSNYQSALTEHLDCQQFKNEYQSFLGSNMVNEIGYCSFNQTAETATPTPTKISVATPTPTTSPTTAPTTIPTTTSTPTPTTESPVIKLGDINNDGSVNTVDIEIIINNYGSYDPNSNIADINNDNQINIVDIGIIIDNYEQ
ncbi:MAG: dockerin type I domain-containing protein [Microgenomates group bacterium]